MSITPMKAIRAKCLDCTAGQVKEVRLCTVKKCALYPYRMGHRPKTEIDTATDSNEQNTLATVGIFTREGV